MRLALSRKEELSYTVSFKRTFANITWEGAAKTKQNSIVQTSLTISRQALTKLPYTRHKHTHTHTHTRVDLTKVFALESDE